MILSHDDSRQFLRLLEGLVCAASYCIELGEPPKSALLTDEYDLNKSLSIITEEPNFIDRFIGFTDLPLSQDDLSVLDQWRHLLRSFLYLVGFAPNGNALFSTGVGIVEVCGITQELKNSKLKPCNVYSGVLVPFKNCISYAFGFMECSVLPSDYLNFFQKDAEENQKKPVIRSAADFISKLGVYQKELEEKEWKEMERKLHREYDKAHGEELLPDGMHKGSLAGLSDKERKAEINKRLEEEALFFQGLSLSGFLRNAINKPIKTSLPEALADLTKNDIIAAGCRLHQILPPSHTKKRLINSVCEFFSPEADSLFSMNGILKFVSNDDYNTFCDAVNNGGKIVMPDDDPAVIKCSSCPPYFFTYWSEENHEVTVAVMPEVMQHYRKLDANSLKEMRITNELIGYNAELCVDYYGMILLEEYVETIINWLKIDSMPPEEIVDVLISAIASGHYAFSYTTLDDDVYLCYPALSLDFTEFVDVEGAEEALLNYQMHLLENHTYIPRRPIEQIAKQGSVLNHVLELDSAKAFRRWLDVHVPDGEDDVAFANNVIRDVVETSRGPIDSNAIVILLYNYGLFVDDDAVTDELLVLAGTFVNDIPSWEYNGFSSEEIRLQRGGKPIFRDEQGMPQIIGDNDLCPCGSGKKYKRCCGR